MKRRYVKSLNLAHGEIEGLGWTLYTRVNIYAVVLGSTWNLMSKPYNHREKITGKEYYQKNRAHIRQRDNETRIKRWLYKNGAFCWICGELDPRYLEEHHLFSTEDNFTINLCANCHRKYRSTKGVNHKLFILRRLSYV